MKMLKIFGVFLGLFTVVVTGSTYEKLTDVKVDDHDIRKVADVTTTRSVTVYKSPTCGCCGEWIKHLEGAGFDHLVKHPDDLGTIKKQFNIAPKYQACHTAVHGDFVFEGHIPAKFIQEFLDNPPSGATGLAVPAMPLGSPGMEVGKRFTSYTVYQLNSNGQATVFAKVSNRDEQY